MSIKSSLLFAAALLAAGIAPAKERTRIPAPEGVLPVVITEMTLRGDLGNAYTEFDRLAYALERVAKERNWPLKVSAEKVAANSPDYLTELRISLQRVQQQIPGEYLYRGWTTLVIDGKERDFGIISYSYRYRMGENMDDVLHKAFLGGAKATAEKIEPLLFPDLKAKK